MSELQARLAQELERQAYSWGHVTAERWQAVLQYAGHHVLDVGCSNGVYVHQLRQHGYTAYGADLLNAPQWSGLQQAFLMSDARFLPFANDAFDTVISFETLEHVPEPGLALQEYYRGCRRNIIISVPNCEMVSVLIDAGLNFNHWIDRTHTNFFTMETLRNLVVANGFQVVSASPILTVLPGLPFFHAMGLPDNVARLLARVARRFSPRQYHMSLLLVAEKR